jgi:hypothetical protein
VKPSHTIRPVFDDPNLVSAAGLVPALRLAESAGFHDLLGGLSVPAANAGAKAASVVGGMLAGADSIDDLDLLRHGGMVRLFGGVRAPSTLGTFLRSNSTLSTIEADQRHRDHALAEQVIAELKDGPLAHLPSGRYTAKAAWVALAVIAFNIARATAVAAAMRTARWATARTRIINVPARIATTGRRLVLHLPTHWPRSGGWELLWATATSPPPTATT